MIASFANSPPYFAVLGLLCGFVGFRLGWRSGNRFLLPLAQGLLGAVAFAAAWRTAGALVAALAVGGWALGLTLAGLYVFRHEGRHVDRRVLGAARYRDEMLDWLRTGRGPESRPLATLRAHAAELAVYLAAALATGNLVSIVMGAVLLNKMNAYVAALLRAAKRPWTVRLLAWNCWSLLRVAAYVALGAACASWLAARAGYPAPRSEIVALAWAGGAGVVADLLLKLALSRPCGRALGAALDWEAFDGAPAAEG